MKTFIEFYGQLTEGIVNPAFVGDKDVTELDNLITKSKDKSKVMDKLTSVFSKYDKQFDSVKSKFEAMVKREIRKVSNVKFLSDKKTIKSVVDKAVNRRRGFAEINDFVRGAVLFQTKTEADAFIKDLLRKNKTAIVGYEEKLRGKDSTYGYYGSHHVDLNIDGIVVELQVMTKKLWNYKHEAHKIYTNNRSKEDGPDKFDRHTSKKIFSMANESQEGETIEFEERELEEMEFDAWENVDLD